MTERSGAELEALVRARLAGRRLVCEADWPDDLVDEIANKVKRLYRLMDRDVARLAKVYPALFATYLVTTGAAGYEWHEFWPATIFADATQRAGEAFLAALRQLDLETFPQFDASAEHAQRFVSRILAHGGIPYSQLPRFFDAALLPALALGYADASALIAAWRRDPPPMTRATLRFLRFGGDTAADFLDRCIDLVRADRAALAADPAGAGVPAAVVRAFLVVPAERVAALTLRPRPILRFAPYAGTGPVAVLPAVGRDLAPRLRWEVHDGAAWQARTASAVREQSVPLLPAGGWTVRSILDGVPYQTAFDALGSNPVVCFGPDGRFLDDTRSLRAEEAWLLVPADVTLALRDSDGERAAEIAEEPEPPPDWPSHRVLRVRLDADALVLRRARAEWVIPIARGAGEPLLVGESAAALLLVDASHEAPVSMSAPVFAQAPALWLPAGTWHVQVRDVTHGTRTDSDLGPGTSALAPFLPAAPALIEVVVRGALGADRRLPFALVPGFSAGVPEHTVGPEVGTVSVPLAADASLALHGKRPGELATLEVPPDEDAGEVWVRGRGHEKLALLVPIPRLRWGLRVDGQATLSTTRLAVEALGTADALVVSGVAPADVPILEVAAGDVHQTVRAPGAGGRYAFSLAPLRDTLRAHATGALTVALLAGGQMVTLAERVPTAPRVPSGGPRLGDPITGIVVAIERNRVRVGAPGWAGVAYEHCLTAPLSAYREGESFTGFVVRNADLARLVLDQRPFRAEAHPLQSDADGVVVRVAHDGVWLDLRDGDALLSRDRLPATRPAESFQPGERVRGRVIDVEPARHIWRLTLVPFDPSGFRPGIETEGRPLLTRRRGLLLDLGAVTGFVPEQELPAGVSAHEILERGRPVTAAVTGIDRRRELILLSMRPFSPAWAVGDQVQASVIGMGNGALLLALPDGSRAAVPPPAIPAHERDDPLAAHPRGSLLDVRITGIDRDRRRISAAFARDTYSFGSDEDESPFAVLRTSDLTDDRSRHRVS